MGKAVFEDIVGVYEVPVAGVPAHDVRYFSRFAVAIGCSAAFLWYWTSGAAPAFLQEYLSFLAPMVIAVLVVLFLSLLKVSYSDRKYGRLAKVVIEPDRILTFGATGKPINEIRPGNIDNVSMILKKGRRKEIHIRLYWGYAVLPADLPFIEKMLGILENQGVRVHGGPEPSW